MKVLQPELMDNHKFQLFTNGSFVMKVSQIISSAHPIGTKNVHNECFGKFSLWIFWVHNLACGCSNRKLVEWSVWQQLISGGSWLDANQDHTNWTILNSSSKTVFSDFNSCCASPSGSLTYSIPGVHRLFDIFWIQVEMFACCYSHTVTKVKRSLKTSGLI